MKAITIVPGKPEQVQVSDLPDPQPEPATLLVQGRLLGICATNVDIVENGYGLPPSGHDRLVIEQAADALAKIDHSWLERLITRRVSMSGFADALHKKDVDVKVVVDLSG